MPIMLRVLGFVALCVLLTTALPARGRAEFTEAERAALLQSLDSRSERLAQISQRIWEFAEVGYQETQSAALLKEELRTAGFTLSENIAGIPTAFSAQFGGG